MDKLSSKTLVSRLLQHWRDWESPTDRENAVNETRMAIDCKAAADEIERLRAMLEHVLGGETPAERTP